MNGHPVSSTFLVTGTSRGIGSNLAQGLCGRGHSVIGCSRGSADISHSNYRHFQLDICQEKSVQGMFADLARDKCPLDVLINNAGLAQSSPVLLTTQKSAQEILSINLIAAFVMAREALKLMKRRKFGRIINFTSINVPLASSGSSIYNASKAALEALSETLTWELIGDDITVNSLGLSLVADSGMASELSPDARQEKLQALAKPALLEIGEIIHAIEFLSARKAKNISGQTIYFGGIR